MRAALDAGLRGAWSSASAAAPPTTAARAWPGPSGVRFLDVDGRELPEGGAALARLARIDLGGADPRLAEAEILVACDVDNPLTGPRGASAVYGPQKGATPEMVAELDLALARYARVGAIATGREVASIPGAGAAGGLGAGLLLFTQARLQPGVEIVLEATGFDALVEGAALVLTGEGRTDFQTAMGKAPVGVAAVARRHGVPVICLSGGLGAGADEVLARGVDALAGIVPEPMALEDAMRGAGALLEAAAARACRLVRVGMRLSDSGTTRR